jgi:hypothetical protein
VSYQSTVPSRGDGFAAQLRAEWTKFWSVRSTKVCLALAVLLTVGLSVLASQGNSTTANQLPGSMDVFSFVHQPLAGDGTVTARVAGQRDSQEWAKAGVIIKADTNEGSTYAALVLTPAHGVRMEAAFTRPVASLPGAAPVWLRLTRSGATVTGYACTDGVTWRRVGTVTLTGLPATVQGGLMVTSPTVHRVVSTGIGSNEEHFDATSGRATFDNVTLASGTVQSGQPAAWSHVNVGPGDTKIPVGRPGGYRQAGGVFTVTGSGDVSGYGIDSWQSPGGDDTVANALLGLEFGLLAVIALGVIFGAAEYRTGIVRTTFAVSPRRGRVVAAKAVVLGGCTLVAGLVATTAAFFASQPGQRSHGYRPPAYPYPSLFEPQVLRAVIGAAVVLAVLGIAGLGLGMLLRRSVRAIVLGMGAMLVPQIVGAAVAASVGPWLGRVTPVAGLAVIQTRGGQLFGISPRAGFAVLAGYAVVALVAAVMLVRRRDA